MSIVTPSLTYFPDKDRGRPLWNASIYIGEPDTDPEIPANQKQVSLRLEDGSLVQVSQPITTGFGGVVTYNGDYAVITVDGDYSVKILDRRGNQVYYIPNNQGIFDASQITITVNGSTTDLETYLTSTVYSTMADLLAATVPAFVEIVTINGFDGGWAATAIGTPIGGHSLRRTGNPDIPGNAGLFVNAKAYTQGGVEWVAVPEGGKYNASMFGVNAGSSYTSEIQDVIDLIPENGGWIHFDGVGAYITNELTFTQDNLKISGQSMDGTKIKLANSRNATLLKNSTRKCFGLLIQDITLDGNKSNNSSGDVFEVVGYQNKYVRVKFTNSANDGVVLDNQLDSVGTPENQFQLCEFKFNNGWATNIKDGTMSDNTWSKCIVAHNGNGLRLNSSGNSVDSWTHFYATDDTGVDVEYLGSGNTVTGCYFDGKPLHNVKYSIFGRGNQFTDNILNPSCDASTTGSASISMPGTSGSYRRGLMITNNTFTDLGGINYPDELINGTYLEDIILTGNDMQRGFTVRPFNGNCVNVQSVYQSIHIKDNQGISSEFTHRFTPSNGASQAVLTQTLGTHGAYMQIVGVGAVARDFTGFMVSWDSTIRLAANSGSSTTVGYGTNTPSGTESAWMHFRDYWSIENSDKPLISEMSI
jgi:hypothetical protein